MLKAIPDNASLNFNTQIIELQFDEYVQVKDLANQLVVTPQTKEMPLVEAKGKKIIIKFDEKLLPNTTYRLFFGNAIADMHEANVLANYEYVFSTGNFIDSLKIEGDVINAFTLKQENDVVVALYTELQNDSVVYFKKPTYFTKTNGSGHFILNYLPKSTFKTIAFSDKNKNLVFDSGEELVGFIDKIVTTGSDTTLKFNVFKEDNAKQYIKKAISPYYGFAYVAYNREQISFIKAVNIEQNKNICPINGFNDTCFVYYNNIYDTLKLIVTNQINKKADTVSIAVLSKEKFDKYATEKKMKLEINTATMGSGILPYYEIPVIKFSAAIDSNFIKKDKILFNQIQDTVKTELPLNYELTKCSELRITNKLLPATNYEIVFKQDAFKSKTNIGSDSIKIVFKTNEPEDYANLTLKVLLPGKENYGIQLINDKAAVVNEVYIEQSISSSTEYVTQFKNLIPGNYFIKVYEDKNKNKMWDTGSYLNKKHAETIFLNNIPIKLLANWDSETEWIVK